jgi:ribonuclease HII
MNVTFMVQAEEKHMPVALASMVSKYTRELLMARFNDFFRRHWPQIKPTAGYSTDGRRFIRDVQPLLGQINLHPRELCRIA